MNDSVKTSGLISMPDSDFCETTCPKHVAETVMKPSFCTPVFYYEAEELKPYKKYEEDAAWDLRSKKELTIDALETFVVPTGVSCIIPKKWVGIIKCRSGLGKVGLNVTAGVIDSTYRGEIGVVIQNLSHEVITLKQYERIGQILVIPCLNQASFLEGTAPTDTERGTDGYGSSGKV